MARFNLDDYETVEERIRRFKKDWPDSRITTELVDVTGAPGATRWTVKASVWRDGENRGNEYDRPDATGLAFEIDGAGGMANSTSALENCETSAIGRALANLNYSGNKRATREEMAKAQRQDAVKEFADKLLEAEKAGDRDKVSRVLQWAQQKGDGQFVSMAQNTLNRMGGVDEPAGA